MNYLEKILDQRQASVERAKQELPLEVLKAEIDPEFRPLPLEKALSSSISVGIIGEIKRASPSEGVIKASLNAPHQALRYLVGGAIGISVLTEPSWFHGSKDDLVQVREVLKHFPSHFLLRKDFIFCEYQVVESVVMKADTVLLIVAVCCLLWKQPTERIEGLRKLIQCCRQYGMEPLVEVFDKAELDCALSAGARVIGINNRNLRSFAVGFEGTLSLLSHVPKDAQTVILSGIREPCDLAPFTARGVRHFLVGTSLVKATNPTRLLALLSKTPPLVKVTGITSSAEALCLQDLPVAMLGLVFSPSRHKSISIEVAKEIRQALGPRNPPPSLPSLFTELEEPDRYAYMLCRLLQHSQPILVGVFANQSPAAVNRIAEEVGLDLVQLDGSEAYQDLYSCPVIKSFPVTANESTTLEVDWTIPYLLFRVPRCTWDGNSASSQLCLQKLRQLNSKRPFMVAGRIGASDVTSLLGELCPWTIDIEAEGDIDILEIQEILKLVNS